MISYHDSNKLNHLTWSSIFVGICHCKCMYCKSIIISKVILTLNQFSREGKSKRKA